MILALKLVLIYLIIGLITEGVARWADEDDELKDSDTPVAILLWPAILGYTLYLCLKGEPDE
jgi:hypothetical protein